ncbi:MAG: AsmA family protein [Acidobacteriota bacterium]|nr:MAG: AsmA family protein [Acidobacteriota bacterium]
MFASYWQSFRTSRWFKPSLIASGIIGLILIALLLIPYLVDINTYRGQIVAQLEDRLGRKVSLGNLSLRIFPSIRVGVEQAAIGENPEYAKGDFIKAKSIRLQMGLMSLLGGNPQVGGIELVEPEVVLIRDQAGNWNWATLKPLTEPADGKEMAPFDLHVENGRFTMIDRTVTPQTESSYTGVNVSLDDFSSKSAFDFSVGITMPGREAGQLKMAGTAGPIDAANAANTPVDARISMDQVEISSLEKLAGLKSPRSGRLTTDIRVKGRMTGTLSAEGDILAENLRLVEGVDPSKDPIEANLKLDLKTIRPQGAKEDDYSLKLDRGDISIGKTKAGLTGTIDRLLADPLLNLKIKADRAALDSLLESAYAFGFGPPKGTSASGLATVDLAVSGAAASPSLKGRIEVNDLKFQTEGLPQAIQVSNLKMTCDPSQIVATPFRTTLGQRTAVDVSNLKITDYSKQPRAHVDVSTSNALIEDLIRIAESFGVRPDIKGTGTASLKAAVDAVLAGETTTLTINGSGKVSNARLETPQLKKPIDVANADLKFTGESARADNLSARLGSSQAGGWVEIKNFTRPYATFDLNINQLSVPEVQGMLASTDDLEPAFSFLPAVSAAAPASNLDLTADGQLAIGKVLLDGMLFNNLRSRVKLQNQILRLDPLSLSMYGGSYQGSAQIDLKSQVPDFALNGHVGGVNLNQFLTALMGSKSVAYGTTNANFNLRGRGQGADQLLKSLSGNGNIAISDGKITSFDLMKQVEVFGRFAGLPSGGAGTAFRSLKTNFRIDHGRLTTDDVQIIMDDLQVTGNGSMQLGDVVTTNYDILAKLSPALSSRVAGRKDTESGGIAGVIGKVTSAAGSFFTEGDSVVVPLKMSGPIGQPSFGLNASVVQKRATERFLGKPGEKSAKPEDAVKGLLDIFQKKKKKPEN